MTLSMATWVGLMVLCGILGSALNAEAKPPVTLTSGIHFTGNTVVRPAIYHLTDNGAGIVQVSGSDFTIDFQHAQIVGPGNSEGIGLHITDARNVTIKNAKVRGCLWGIVIERSMGVKLLDCESSHNADLPPGTVIDESGKEPEDNHGGGILLRDSRRCLVQRCIAQYQWDGIDVIRSEENVIEDGDYSYNGNWGIHLWNSSRNVFRRNRAIWCTTGSGTLYQALTGWQTYDAQAVGIDHNSNENLIEENDLRFSGDGIFIRANEGPITPGTVVPPKNGSHRNILRNNDCSFSPNNAIEVDLVDDTIIEGNNCSFSHYGMWLGYSRRCIVRNNICINDTAHAVEIENGQGDVFEHNVFGFDTANPEQALVYLRQNARDKTPSGPYTFRGNVFYGSGIGVLLKATSAQASGNTMLWDSATAKLLTGDAASKITLGKNDIQAPGSGAAPEIVRQQVALLTPNALFTLHVRHAQAGKAPPVVAVAGVPVWVRKVEGDAITFWMPADFWLSPAQSEATVSVFNGQGKSEILLPLRWPEGQPRLESLAPNPARPGALLTLTGANLGNRVLLNGKPIPILESSPTKLIARLPEDMLMTTHYNLLVESGAGDQRKRTWPLPLTVQVPPGQIPHLVSATFSPTRLQVGELLTVTFVLRNNLPYPAPLLVDPKPPYTYEEKQAWYDVGIAEKAGTLHLRVTSDHPAGHQSGEWPWMFGFGQPTLAAGETMTVTGSIRVETPGEHVFRVGLVATGSRFLDDNAFPTKITVLPH